jgi:hypothetical protein
MEVFVSETYHLLPIADICMRTVLVGANRKACGVGFAFGFAMRVMSVMVTRKIYAGACCSMCGSVFGKRVGDSAIRLVVVRLTIVVLI